MNSRTDVTQMIGTIEMPARTSFPKVSDYFAVNTFNEDTMHKTVSVATFKAFKKWQDQGAVITPSQADEIAEAMKDWAMTKGATAYTHWFHPMTGLTAEKHDSFIRVIGPCQVIEKFTGTKLIQGEPDASSFPSGGLRATFEARGYTAWDPSSPAFITESAYGRTLCIPSIFISYNGEALDKKLPLLRSDAALSKSALGLLDLFGNKDSRRVYSACGPEQEYFLIDQGYYKLRADLQLTGRTLVGAPSPKGQQLEDQYFGSIKERVLNYMTEVAEEAHKLGIPVTTRHNEVAPHQFEFAPVYERSNLAADHNQLLMDVMKKVAKRHGFECLLHEKPFAKVNGSGKHLNWSLEDDRGQNMLNPGDKPGENPQFLTFLLAVVRAVFLHGDLLRASVANAGNEHRLGANEAPPAIMSVFLGEQLTQILKALEKGKVKKSGGEAVIDLKIAHLPQFIRDTTDRNRTSPFAFTGNKFEFRALGSSANISTPISVINTIVAESIDHLAAAIRKAARTSDFGHAVLSILTETVKECKAILFEGNNYSDEWVKEAAHRGLPNEPSSTRSLNAFVKPTNVKLFEKYGVYSKAELASRQAIWIDIYNKVVDIEARTLWEMVNTQVLPAAYDFQIEVGNSVDVLRDLAQDEAMALPIGALDDRKDMFSTLTADVYYIRKHLRQLKDMITAAEGMHEDRRAEYYFQEVKPHMEHLRHHVDDLETMMPDDLWQLPKYREMLFIA